MVAFCCRSFRFCEKNSLLNVPVQSSEGGGHLNFTEFDHNKHTPVGF